MLLLCYTYTQSYTAVILLYLLQCYFLTIDWFPSQAIPMVTHTPHPGAVDEACTACGVAAPSRKLTGLGSSCYPCAASYLQKDDGQGEGAQQCVFEVWPHRPPKTHYELRSTYLGTFQNCEAISELANQNPPPLTRRKHRVRDGKLFEAAAATLLAKDARTGKTAERHKIGLPVRQPTAKNKSRKLLTQRVPPVHGILGFCCCKDCISDPMHMILNCVRDVYDLLCNTETSGDKGKKALQALQRMPADFWGFASDATMAPWLLLDKFQTWFDNLAVNFPYPGDLPPLRKACSDKAFLKTSDWAAIAGEAGRYLLRTVLSAAGMKEMYISLFTHLLATLAELQRTFFSNRELTELSLKIAEISTWREILLPFNYSCLAIHHTWLHVVDSIRRHGPCPSTWNYAAERAAGQLKNGIWSHKGLEKAILCSDAILFEAALREATELHLAGQVHPAERDVGAVEGGAPHSKLRDGLTDSLRRSDTTVVGSAIFLRQGRREIADLLDIECAESKKANSFFPLQAEGEQKHITDARKGTFTLYDMLTDFHKQQDEDYDEDAATPLERSMRECGHSSEITLHSRIYLRGQLIRTAKVEAKLKSRSSGVCLAVETRVQKTAEELEEDAEKRLEEQEGKDEEAAAAGAAQGAGGGGGRGRKRKRGGGGRARASVAIDLGDRKDTGNDYYWKDGIRNYVGETQKIITWKLWDHPESPRKTYLGVLWGSGYKWSKKMQCPTYVLDPANEHNCSNRLIPLEQVEPMNVLFYNAEKHRGRSATKDNPSTRYDVICVQRGLKNAPLGKDDFN